VALRSQSRVFEMKVLCAWCCHEGQPGYLGEKEPLESPLPTHGVCAHHKALLLESLPSRSFPDAEVLIVVSRGHAALYERLRWSFADTARVEVIVDRRVADRRAAPGQRPAGRRQQRTRRIREGTSSPLGDFTMVRFTPKAPLSQVQLDQRTGAPISDASLD
jgi:hypothetical protein